MRIIFILIVLIIFGCGTNSGKDYHLDEESFDAKNLKMIEQRTGIVFPNGSRGLKMFYKGADIDPSFISKVEIPTSELKIMTEKIEKLRNMSGSVSGSLTEKVPWWKISETTIQAERQFTFNGNYVRVILCKEGDRSILYLEWIKI